MMETIEANMVLEYIRSVKLLSLKTLSSVDSNQTWPIYRFAHNCQKFTADKETYYSLKFRVQEILFCCLVLPPFLFSYLF